jgi:carboxyl-terminal processing protease
MSRCWYAVLLVVCFLAVVMGGGCSTSEQPLPAEQSVPFAAPEAHNMFKVAYAAIVERFVDPVSAEQIALDGLSGLATIDPALTVAKLRNDVELDFAGRRVMSVPTPKSRDVDGWAQISVQIWRAARAHSTRLAAAPQESVYEAVFDRMTASLDANSRYATPEEARQNRQRRDGYHGIGIGIRMEGDAPVISEITGAGPAERAGLRVGDVLVQIDGRPLSGLSQAEIESLLQEEVTGRVRLTVRRLGRTSLRFVVQRSYLIPDRVKERYEDGILFLAISHFNRDTADNIARTWEGLSMPPSKQLRGVVLDLRGNPGGLLQQAVKVADLFLADGPILSTRGRHPDSVQDYVAGGDDITHGLPLVILIDGDTASAAELTAAALQDRDRAIVIGSTSYGKGTVQTVIPLPNGGELGFTWSHAVSPTGGANLRASGVRPLLCTSGLYVGDPDAFDRVLSRPSAMGGENGSSSCPAERRDGTVDPELARRLIDQPDIFADALHRVSLVAQVPEGAVP